MNHGTTTAYKHGCRCDACAETHRRYRKDYAVRGRERSIDGRAVITRPQTVPTDTVVAHLWALVDSGWTMTQIAAELGMGRNHLWNIRAGKAIKRIRLTTAAAILALEPLPTVDHDPVVVDRLVAMYPNGTWRDVGGREATIAERHAALQRLDTRAQRAALRRLGYGDQQIDLPSYDDVRKWLGLGTHTLQRLAREAS